MQKMTTPQRVVPRLVAAMFAATLPLSALAAGDTASRGDARASQPSPTAAEKNRGSTSRMDTLWKRLDTNDDGNVSRSEFNAYHGDTYHGTSRTQAAAKSGSGAATGLKGAFYASGLIGTQVTNLEGEGLGEIHDVLIDVGSGRVEGVVLSFGGIMNLGDKLFSYPMASFTRAADGERLILNVDRQALQRAKGFDRDNWPFAEQAATSGQGRLWRASRLMGRDVDDREGEHLGEIQDLAIDARTRRVDHVILNYDRPWSLDNPVVALPLAMFDFDKDRENVSMNIEKDRIDSQRFGATGAVVPARGDVVVERWILILPATDAAQNASGDASARSSAATATSSVARTSERRDNRSTIDAGGQPMASPMAAPTAKTVEFDVLDRNRDGQLDRGEYQAQANAGQAFASADRDSSGAVTREEYAAGAGTAK